MKYVNRLEGEDSMVLDVTEVMCSDTLKQSWAINQTGATAAAALIMVQVCWLIQGNGLANGPARLAPVTLDGASGSTRSGCNSPADVLTSSSVILGFCARSLLQRWEHHM